MMASKKQKDATFMAVAFLILAVVQSIVAESVEEPDLVVKTHHGRVRGTIRYATGSDRPVYSYFGIPYARSPDYTFRFRPPVDPWNWTEVKNVNNDRVPFCYQDREYLKNVLNNSVFQFFIDENHPMSEDCLNLNVFTPNLPSSNSKPLPVIVWIHGGSLQITASTHKMWMLSAYEDVVLVTVQYRLGIFGFMSFDDHWAPPNSGLFDQVKALEWIQKNIRNFGGNPDSVTLFGISSGGVSVSAHAVSPVSKGLFHRVIAGSGVYTIPINWGRNHEKKATQIAEKLGCNLREVSFTTTCLRNKITSSRLVEAARDLEAKFFLYEDGDFFTSHPEQLQSSLDSSVPILVGVTAGEMDFVILRKFLPKEYFGPKLNRSVAKQIVKNNLLKFHSSFDRVAMDKLIELYLKNDSDWKQLLLDLSEFFADSFFDYPAKQFAAAAKDKGGSVYFYQFSKKPSYYDKAKSVKRCTEVKRADHADDQPFFFGFPFLPDVVDKGLAFTEKEKLLSRKMMKMLATFAATGQPEFDQSLDWPEYPSYIDINEATTVKDNFRSKYLDVWKRLYDHVTEQTDNQTL